MKKRSTTVSRKPLNPKLPGRYGKMTAAQLDAVSDGYERANSGVTHRAPRKAESAKLAKARRVGRPRKPDAEKAIKVNVSFRPELLREADRHAKRIGVTRAGLIESALEAALKPNRRTA